MDASQIGKRAWSYAGVMRDAGLSRFEYVEQLTLLLFHRFDTARVPAAVKSSSSPRQPLSGFPVFQTIN